MREFISRCIVKLLNTKKPSQTAQVRLHSDEVIDDMEYHEPYGFTSSAPTGKREGVALFLGGDRSNGFLIAVGNRQYRINNLEEGEVALYDDQGQYVKLLKNGHVQVKANTKVLADCPLFETTADVKINGNLEVIGQVITQGTTSSKAGYTGANGGVAEMIGGIKVVGALTVNGKNVSDSHTHTSTSPGTKTSSVN